MLKSVRDCPFDKSLKIVRNKGKVDKKSLTFIEKSGIVNITNKPYEEYKNEI